MPENEVEQMYTTKQASVMFQVTEYTIRQWMKDGKLKAVKVGKRWRIPHSALVELADGKYGDES